MFTGAINETVIPMKLICTELVLSKLLTRSFSKKELVHGLRENLSLALLPLRALLYRGTHLVTDSSVQHRDCCWVYFMFLAASLVSLQRC